MKSIYNKFYMFQSKFRRNREADATLERPENPAGCAVADWCVFALKLIVEATRMLRGRRLVAIHQIPGSMIMH